MIHINVRENLNKNLILLPTRRVKMYDDDNSWSKSRYQPIPLQTKIPHLQIYNVLPKLQPEISHFKILRLYNW